MSKLIDLTGQKFGRLTVIKKDTNKITNSGSYWICQCECGNVKSIKSSSLRRGEIISCGCYQKEQIAKAKYEQSEKEMIGRRFGKLTVLKRSEKKGKGGALYWTCQCDCGNIIDIQGTNLKRKDGNQTISCGCYHRSIGEMNVDNCLSSNNISFISQYAFIDLPRSHFDFAIVKDNQVIRLVEFDGEQHFMEIKAWGSLKLQQERDQKKNEYALSHNIPLVRIPYWERDNITLDMIMGDKYLIK